MLKSLSRAVSTAIRISTTGTTSSARALQPLTRSALCSTNSGTIRPFTRSLWMMNNNSGAASGYRPKLFSSKGSSPVSCGCESLHTEGDKAFGDFLSDEIKEEKKIQKHKALPKMSGGWELEQNGTEAKLIKMFSGEKVTVTFNVDNSIPPNFEEESEQAAGQKSADDEPDVVSTPNFVVEVTKPSAKHSLVFDCHYPEDEATRGEGEEESDIFAIREVSFQPEGDVEWKETSYNLNTDSLDWALYDHLMDFLADRGVDNTFADELMELSTAMEHHEYIKFLEDLSGFVKCN
ncbi:complement component 1 Q subcomponent-binding protein, mitochondrial [Esox lucius]|uniref:Complement component 1 Q subcomponent-binding protein, mitochondrial n=1 Tax=Esox lucius TaxID=8010 RepID=C1BWG7_ESOLU|nr:complement component 1 Q subcomponent-binding protein, mitochondrial [Esox lucius]ACO13370.1 Complement component 1 Q subcomponent-binding protein, mitochondrial precursor [Esox lucius]